MEGGLIQASSGVKSLEVDGCDQYLGNLGGLPPPVFYLDAFNVVHTIL